MRPATRPPRRATPTAAAPAPAAAPAWRRLGQAPHRLGFAAGALMLLLGAAWWGAVLGARQYGIALPWAVAPATAHALVMGLGFAPLFFIGFLFTAAPRWLAVAPLPARRLVAPVGVVLVGWLGVLTGAHWGAGVAALGLALVAAGLAWAFGLLALLLRHSAEPDRLHLQLVLLGGVIGVVALAVAALALALRIDAAARAAAHAALWGCVALVFASVEHRMIPFLSAAALPTLQAWQPRAMLGLLTLPLLWLAPLAALQAAQGGAPAPLLALLRAVVELPAGVLLLVLAARWVWLQGLRFRLVVMLNVGLAWLGLALALGGAAHATAALRGGTPPLGLAPVHALTMGYFGSTLLAMVTRVLCGQSGRAVVVDRVLWVLFWVLQLAVLARVGAEGRHAGAPALLLGAAAAWCGVAGAWVVRYGRWLLQPRVDGRAD